MTTFGKLDALDPSLSLTLRDHVHKALRHAIIAGRYPFETRLNERQLAEELGVSTTPLKEAIRQLESEGLVRTLPRRGVVVLYGRTWAEEMILARAALEAMIARLAAQRIDEAGRESLRAAIADMTKATAGEDPDLLIARNEAFHDRIHRASECLYLGGLIGRQRLYDASARRVIHSDGAEKALALAEHTGIGTAILTGDIDEAERTMRNHVMRSGEVYIRLVFGNRTSPAVDLSSNQ